MTWGAGSGLRSLQTRRETRDAGEILGRLRDTERPLPRLDTLRFVGFALSPRESPERKVKERKLLNRRSLGIE